MKNKQTNEGSAQAGIVAGTLAGLVADIIRSKDGKDYQYRFPLADLPWDNADFQMKMLQVACGGITWRSSSSLKILPDNGGLVSAEIFIKAVMALDFRGDEKPNAADIKEGKRIFDAIDQQSFAEGATPFTLEDAVKQIQKQYGWLIEPTPEGFAKHEMNKRIKAAAEKSKKVTLDVL